MEILQQTCNSATNLQMVFIDCPISTMKDFSAGRKVPDGTAGTHLGNASHAAATATPSRSGQPVKCGPEKITG
jgi:hypothetical protein